MNTHVGEYARAIDALPPECVVGELVDVVPRQLLRQEVLDPTLLDDLRELTRVNGNHVGHTNFH